MGAETKNLVYEGKGEFKGVAFDFSGPVKILKLQYALGTTWNEDMKYNANIFEEKEFKFDVNQADLKVTYAAGTTDEQKMKAEDQTKLLDMLTKQVGILKDKTYDGDEAVMPAFPMDVAAIFAGMFYAVQFAETVEFNEKFMNLGFSLKHFEMLSDKQNNLLKPIVGDFHSDISSKGEPALVQVLFDDNLFNSLAAVIVSVEKMFSFRELTKGNPKAKPTL